MYEEVDDFEFSVTGGPSSEAVKPLVGKKRKRSEEQQPPPVAESDEEEEVTPPSLDINDDVLVFRVTTTNYDLLQKLLTIMKEIAGMMHALIQFTREGINIFGMSKSRDAHMSYRLRNFHQLHMREGFEQFQFSVYPREFVRQFSGVRTGSSLSWYIHQDDLDEQQCPIQLRIAIVHDNRSVMVLHDVRVSRPSEEIVPMSEYSNYAVHIRTTPKEIMDMLKSFTMEKEQNTNNPPFVSLQSHQSRLVSFSSNHHSKGMYVSENGGSKKEKELQYVHEEDPETPVNIMVNYRSFVTLMKCSNLSMPCLLMMSNNMPLRLKFDLGRNGEADFFLHIATNGEKSDSKTDLI